MSVKDKPKKNSLFAYFQEKPLEEDEVALKRSSDAAMTVTAKEAPTHKPRSVPKEKERNSRSERVSRPISSKRFDTILIPLADIDRRCFRFDNALKMAWCDACTTTVRDDNIVRHCGSDKHISRVPLAGETLRRQSSIKSAMIRSSAFSKEVYTENHLFR